MTTIQKTYNKPASKRIHIETESTLLAGSNATQQEKNIPIYDDGLPDGASAQARRNSIWGEDNE